ncbi:MAG: GDSL-type esterase/lipase family protein [Sulfurovum sp.]|nr:GDSL-type esterase/lipase family protein [Sulfurovum sp.]
MLKIKVVMFLLISSFFVGCGNGNVNVTETLGQELVTSSHVTSTVETTKTEVTIEENENTTTEVGKPEPVVTTPKPEPKPEPVVTTPKPEPKPEPVVVTPTKKIRIACVGDSITDGYGLSEGISKSYPAQMQGMLGNNYEVKNFGIFNKTLMKSGDDPYWNHSHFNASYAYKADIVVIMLGTNDTKDWNWDKVGANFIKDYKALIQTYKNLSPTPKIYIGKLVPAFGSVAGISNDRINELNDKVMQIASSENIQVIDTYGALINKEHLFQGAGNLHPNTEGTKILAQTIFNKIKQ